jgi:hypothetical protein
LKAIGKREGEKLSLHERTEDEIRFLRDALKADFAPGNIRLREGEYQYDLAKAIASFQLEMYFPDVKEIIKRLYGEDKANDVQFVRKIQTILKKMEKSDIVRILPKKTPWELQKYSLTGFKFEDSDKNRVILASDEEMQQSRGFLNQITLRERSRTHSTRFLIQISALSALIVASYAAIIWTLVQPIINPTIFIPAFLVAVLCSILLGRTLSNK